ncbi:hypothetical protein Hypma_002941 [Hypsizygus marmoreus]|uniref:Uncharacterized protein n=1 Tax=Hypsizygus marmoreus TaxID=39966 RepID=A0A369J4Q4_HYPMA|nr:hypothetical protein Hypma_002941 [Hypsizygus marmoreus]
MSHTITDPGLHPELFLRISSQNRTHEENMAFKDDSPVDRDRLSDAGTSNTTILSDRETWAAKAILSETLLEVERLNLEIAHAPEVPDDLIAQRDKAVALADNIRTAIAPHKRIPPELSHAYQRDIEDWSSSRGRQLFLFLSQLRLQYPTGSGPLTLEFYISGDRTFVGRLNTLHPIIYLLSPFLPFLRELHLFLPLSWCVGLLMAPALNLACLEVLSLDCDVDDIDNPMFHPDIDDFLAATRIFSVASGLRKLKLRGLSDFVRLHYARFPWVQLTDLDLSAAMLTAASAVNILRQCSQLVGCHLRTCSSSNLNILQMEIALPYLQSLAWIQFDHIAEHFFQCLVVPSLTELRIASIFIPEIASMIQNSQCSVEILQCENPHDNSQVAPYLDDILSRMPTLVEFETSLQVTMSTLEKISSGELLPCLKVWKSSTPLESIKPFVSAFENRLRNQDAQQTTLPQVRSDILRPQEIDRCRPLSWIPESVAEQVERIRDEYGIDLQLRPGFTWCLDFSLRLRILL